MSSGSDIKIEVCSKCNQHPWCTRHDEATYLKLASELKSSLDKDVPGDVSIEVVFVSGSKMGSFEVTVDGTLLFSKLALGYFPHIPLLTERVVNYIEDKSKGADMSKYNTGGYSPIKQNPNLHPYSPKKKQADPNSPYLKNNSAISKASNKAPAPVKASPPPPPAQKEEIPSKKEEVKKESPVKEEPKKEEQSPAKEETKKEEPPKEESVKVEEEPPKKE